MVDAACKNTKKSFLSGVLLLTLSTVLVKVVGLVYKIPMLAYLGSEGMGYFNSAYEIYTLFCVISTAGLPVALSVLISGAVARGNGERVKRIYRAALTVFLIIGILGSLIMVIGAKRFCDMIQSERAYLSIVSIAPTVFLVCLSSAIRGYFQGYQRMLPTAVSQILESVGKLVFGLSLAHYALMHGYDTAAVASFAGWGLTLGTAASVIYLIVEKLHFHPECELSTASKKTDYSEKYREIWHSLARLAIPMTLGASLVSLTKLVDMTMILRRLQSIGYDEVAANEAYGGYTTLALSVFGLLPALVNAVALPLVPILSAAIASGDRQKQAEMIQSSYRLTATFAIPAALGVAAYARPILLLLFGHEPEAVAVAAPLLSCLGVSVFLSCMITASNSVLHAYQVVNRPILAMLIGSVVKIVSAYFLIGNASVGLLGAPLSTFLCDATVVTLNLYFTASLCHAPSLRKIFVRPMLCALLSIGGSYTLYLILLHRMGESSVLTLASLLFTLALYLVLSCALGVFDAESLRVLPMGDKLFSMLQKLRLMRSEDSIKK